MQAAQLGHQRVPPWTRRLLAEAWPGSTALQRPACGAGGMRPYTRCQTASRSELVGASMPKLRVNAFTISVDGYGAGPNQDVNNPLGVGGMALHEWAFATRTFRQMFGRDGGETGIDNDFVVRGFDNIGAWILGRNMFGPVRGPWPDNRGRAGGATTRRITRRFSCSPTMSGRPSP